LWSNPKSYSISKSMGWNEKQLSSLQSAEIVSLTLSLPGYGFILIMDCSSSSFRKLVRTFLFYTSFGNIHSAVANLIARLGLKPGKTRFDPNFGHSLSSSEANLTI
jgi:hypothetical protein